MDALKFLKTAKRMCNKRGQCTRCPIHDFCNNDFNECSDALFLDTIKAVEQWAKDHQIKTRQSEFLRMFPDAETDESGILIFCPRKFDPENINSVHCHRHGCLECRKDYWLTEVTEND